ncbi:hypothetical protein [Desulfopila aestuarii]|uniref:hypothetical protein n=1 Tax=Desulfopila aestuarii TaxID=231440 RepID=UPI0013565471|nr:hypothetical protein [Desulfopila aestuarii]
MKLRPADIVAIILAVAVMVYIFSNMLTTRYPHTTAEEVEVKYHREQAEAKPWP